MQIDPREHAPAELYKLLTGCVLPRPIAWVTTMGAEGRVNLAPATIRGATAKRRRSV